MLVNRTGRLDEVQMVGSWAKARTAAKIARRMMIPAVRTAVPFEFSR